MEDPPPHKLTPSKLNVMKQVALWSCVCVIMEDPSPLAGYPPGLTPPAWHEIMMDDWSARPFR